MESANCVVELAKAADIKPMLDLWRSIPGLGVGRGDTESSLKAFLVRNPTTCLLLRVNGCLMGTVLGGFDGRRGYIYHLAVHPDYQGRGYGKMLLSRVSCQLKDLGAPKIHLFAFGDNHTAEGFYLCQGWEKRRDIQVFSWDTNEDMPPEVTPSGKAHL
ncbi:MAG: GNAT family N-acetyltransferase [Syntrophaceticus sp.]|nr:GNAT family N-acetyltransferase [Syntrophaceticus sp.]